MFLTLSQGLRLFQKTLIDVLVSFYRIRSANLWEIATTEIDNHEALYITHKGFDRVLECLQHSFGAPNTRFCHREARC